MGIGTIIGGILFIVLLGVFALCIFIAIKPKLFVKIETEATSARIGAWLGIIGGGWLLLTLGPALLV